VVDARVQKRETFLTGTPHACEFSSILSAKQGHPSHYGSVEYIRDGRTGRAVFDSQDSRLRDADTFGKLSGSPPAIMAGSADLGAENAQCLSGRRESDNAALCHSKLLKTMPDRF